MSEVIAIAMTAHNDAAWLRRSVDSFLAQKDCHRALRLVISLDSCIDDSESVIQEYMPDDRIVLLKVAFGSAHQNRNHILQHVRSQIPSCVLVGRLDADDELSGPRVLSMIEGIYDFHAPDVILAGNHQRVQGAILPLANLPDPSLLIPEKLLDRLERMANGDFSAELPSCNTFFRPSLPLEYRQVESAEDHWLLVELLMQYPDLSIYIDPALIYCIYSLDRAQTKGNHESGSYFDSRRQLFEFAKNWKPNGR